MSKQVVTADDILYSSAGGEKMLNLREEDCIVTPGARDKMEELGIQFAVDHGNTPVCGLQADQDTVEKISNTLVVGNSSSMSSPVDSITNQVCKILQDKFPQGSVTGLESIVKKIVVSKLSSDPISNKNDKNPAFITCNGVSLINGDILLDEKSSPAIPGKVLISDAIRCHEDSHLTATYMKWEKSSFSRTVESSEVSIVIEGELKLVVDGKSFKAKAGDILYMAKGALVEYSTPSMVKLACVSS